MITLAIDPSLSCSGWALFGDGTLLDCGIVPTTTRETYHARIRALSAELYNRVSALRNRINDVVIEWPVVYEGAARKGRPEDLMWLAAVAGAALAVVTPEARLTLVTPSEWKGQVEKKIHNDRVLKRLAKNELDTLDNRVNITLLRHNAIDAIGIGLKFLGRMEAASGAITVGKEVPAGSRTTSKRYSR